MKHRIIECQTEFKNFDKYVSSIGLSKLLNANEGSVRNDVNDNPVPEWPANYQVFKSNPERDNEIMYSIIPYGAGGSFLGMLQELAKGSISLNGKNPKDRHANLWDDHYGINFKDTPTFDNPGMNRTADRENDITKYINRDLVLYDLWQSYLSFVRKFDTVHELQYHVDLLTLPFFIKCRCLMFLNMSHEEFVWTHFLAGIKHDHNNSDKSITRFFNGKRDTINVIRPQLERCNTEWQIHCISKNYGPPAELDIEYKDLVIDHKYSAVESFLQVTNNADTSPGMIKSCQDLLTDYHSENLKLMKNWDSRKDELLNSYKWDRTHG